LCPTLAFGLAGVLTSGAWFGPVLAGSRNPVSFLLFLGLPGLAAAVAGALLGRPLVAPSRPRSGWWAARRGAGIATVALMLFAPMFATVIKWTEPGWPAPALAWVGGHGGGHEFRGGQERFEHFHRPLIGLYPYPYYADSYDSPPACYWQEGYWGPNQPYLDQYGFERFEPVWIPAQWVCD